MLDAARLWFPLGQTTGLPAPANPAPAVRPHSPRPSGHAPPQASGPGGAGYASTPAANPSQARPPLNTPICTHQSGRGAQVASNSQSTELARTTPVQPCPSQAPQAHSQASGGNTPLRSPSARTSPAEPPIRPGATHRPQSRPAPASHLSKPPQIPIAIQHPFVTHLIL